MSERDKQDASGQNLALPGRKGNQSRAVPIASIAEIGAGSCMVWTVGHSTRSIEEFLGVLSAHGIEAVIDVRRFPVSRRFTWFNAKPLAASLDVAGIAYCSLPSLGGRRMPRPDSPNTGWRHASFRGYADHMQTEEFAEGLFELLMIAGGLRTTVMCAELLWWRCHRRLIADQLVALGTGTWHIESAKPAERHRLVHPARLIDGQLSYQDQPVLF
jgi:uncharacterized protein (DUF488 family)